MFALVAECISRDSALSRTLAIISPNFLSYLIQKGKQKILEKIKNRKKAILTSGQDKTVEESSAKTHESNYGFTHGAEYYGGKK